MARLTVLLVVTCFGMQVAAPIGHAAQHVGSISGKVAGASGAPRAGVTVVAQPIDDRLDRHLVDAIQIIAGSARFNTDRLLDALRAGREPDLTRAITDERGEYRLDGLRHGAYALTFELACYSRHLETVTLDPDALLRKDLMLIRPATISGRIVTPDLEPAAAVPVVTIPSPISPPPMSTLGIAPCPGREPTRPPVTARDGSYSLEVSPGTYFVRAAGSGRGATMLTYYPGVRREGDATAIVVAEGDVVQNVDIRLEPAAPGLVVQLLDGNGVGITNLQVSYGFAGARHRGSRTGQSAQPDARGRIFIHDPTLPTGPVTVFLFADGESGRLAAFGKALLTEDSPTMLDLRLGSPATVHGRVVADDSGDIALSDVQLRFVPIGYVPHGHESTTFTAPAHSPFLTEGLVGYYRAEISPSSWQIRSMRDHGRAVDWSQLEFHPNDIADLEVVIGPSTP